MTDSERPPGQDTAEDAGTEQREVEYVIVTRRRSLFRRIGCGAVLVIWFVVMLLPIALFVLAMEGTIFIAHPGDIPNSHEHPLLRVNLITEIDFRGVSVAHSSLEYSGDHDLCIQTDVRYVLWQGEGEPASFCDCYVRDGEDASWEMASRTMDACD
jgi:hypothetical protein